ncbi:hypothetical protein [Lacipirellula parvula]|uniref:Uncharacterized protein n=1 Tax=Lacipirellula parvula TaxID=2650471 RepID=A0A5K7XIE5_9BACT|nr:hypothetical protein [Lacipirellula parvula]BBO34731.1 hypothetical protein PLANPX_4343 [Lacipirellula parvula]
MPVDWTNVPTVEIPPPPKAYCPACQSGDFTIVRSMGDQGDGSVFRRCVCRSCSAPFLVVVDPMLASDWQDQVDTSVEYQHHPNREGNNVR